MDALKYYGIWCYCANGHNANTVLIFSLHGDDTNRNDMQQKYYVARKFILTNVVSELKNRLNTFVISPEVPYLLVWKWLEIKIKPPCHTNISSEPFNLLKCDSSCLNSSMDCYYCCCCCTCSCCYCCCSFLFAEQLLFNSLRIPISIKMLVLKNNLWVVFV